MIPFTVWSRLDPDPLYLNESQAQGHVTSRIDLNCGASYAPELASSGRYGLAATLVTPEVTELFASRRSRSRRTRTRSSRPSNTLGPSTSLPRTSTCHSTFRPPAPARGGARCAQARSTATLIG